MDPGFSTEEAGIAWLDLSASQIPRGEQDALRVDLEDRLRAQPGIHTVASASRLPLSLGNDFRGFRIPGVDLPPGQKGHRIDLAQVAPGYFQALGIPLLAGRDFRRDDQTGAPEVVVVNQAMATRFWPGEDPLGKEIFRDTDDRPLTVVGVVRDTKVSTMGEAPRPVVYFSMAQVPPGNLQVLVRGRLSAGELVATLRRVLREAYPDVLVLEVKTMTEHLSVRLFGTRAAAVLLGTFGALALLLSSLGLYGVVSFSVSRRVREVGIRMSLGARRRDVVGNILRRSMAGVAAGGLAGLGLAFFLARLIRVLLVGVSPLDPLTWAAIPLLLGSVALLAAYVPARRSTRVNPVEALRSE
jgi:predicted permease